MLSARRISNPSVVESFIHTDHGDTETPGVYVSVYEFKSFRVEHVFDARGIADASQLLIARYSSAVAALRGMDIDLPPSWEAVRRRLH